MLGPYLLSCGYVNVCVMSGNSSPCRQVFVASSVFCQYFYISVKLPWPFIDGYFAGIFWLSLFLVSNFILSPLQWHMSVCCLTWHDFDTVYYAIDASLSNCIRELSIDIDIILYVYLSMELSDQKVDGQALALWWATVIRWKLSIFYWVFMAASSIHFHIIWHVATIYLMSVC